MRNRKILLTILALLMTLTLFGCTFTTRATVLYESPAAYEQLRIDTVARVEPSVVAVITETGHGSGIIYQSEPVISTNPDVQIEEGLTRYYIMTNYHVVEDGGEMRIHFGKGKTDIPVVDFQGYKPYDIAVVRIETTKALRVHTVQPIVDNSIIQILKGQDVFAIGTPQNIDKFNYVTSGIVSLNTYAYDNIPGLAFMHDAELNPGNSGGPLFNLKGDLIGINVAKIADIQTKDGVISAEGLNYALNINKLAPMVKNFKEANYVKVERKPKLGVTIQEIDIFLNEHDASLIPENQKGVVVVDFDLSRNAYRVLEKYDLIIKINNKVVESIADLANELKNAQFGDAHELTVLRKVDGVFIEYTVTVILA